MASAQGVCWVCGDIAFAPPRPPSRSCIPQEQCWARLGAGRRHYLGGDGASRSHQVLTDHPAPEAAEPFASRRVTTALQVTTRLLGPALPLKGTWP